MPSVLALLPCATVFAWHGVCTCVRQCLEFAASKSPVSLCPLHVLSMAMSVMLHEEQFPNMSKPNENSFGQPILSQEHGAKKMACEVRASASERFLMFCLKLS